MWNEHAKKLPVIPVKLQGTIDLLQTHSIPNGRFNDPYLWSSNTSARKAPNNKWNLSLSAGTLTRAGTRVFGGDVLIRLRGVLSRGLDLSKWDTLDQCLADLTVQSLLSERECALLQE
jgi:hypothetical protein